MVPRWFPDVTVRLFVFFFLEEKECSELPEQPSAPGGQEERSV